MIERECDLSETVPSALFARYVADSEDGIQIMAVDLAVDGETILLNAAQGQAILDGFGPKILAACERAAKGER